VGLRHRELFAGEGKHSFVSYKAGLGILIAIIPLILKLRRDPFDAAGSYAIWWGGFFVVSTIMSLREPSQAKRVAQGVGLGLPTALIGYFIVTPESANLWPLSLIVGTLVEIPPSFAGAYFGKFLRITLKGRSEKGES
jgi:CDP-diglyceride synthetase